MSIVFRSAMLLTALACSASCAKAPESDVAKVESKSSDSTLSAAANAMTEKQRNSYMVGMDVAKSLDPIKDEVDIATMTEAMQAVFAKKTTKLTPAEAEKIRAAFGAKLQTKMAAKAAADSQNNLKAGEAFLAANKTRPGVHATASGLQYQVIRQGSGATPALTDTVSVNYKGTLLDGTQFDSSYDRGQPAEFALNQVIPGWGEGVTLMSAGSKYRFWIPANLAYGPNGQPPIGPNSTLVFDVELLKIGK